MIALVDAGYDTQDVRDAIHEVNGRLIPLYRKNWEAEKENLSLFFKLGWCLLQNEDSKTGVSLMEGIVPDQANSAEYHSLLGRFYYNEKEYAKAEEQFLSWLESIRLEPAVTESEKEALPARFGTAYSLLAASRKMQEDYEGRWRQQGKRWSSGKTPPTTSRRRMRFSSWGDIRKAWMCAILSWGLTTATCPPL
mgnify:CR=1 FL=1